MSDITDHSFDPPTFFRTNDFISSFQKIVDTYGVASYKEINPVPFYMITFPFLFGVMFGDIGHGGILFMLGLIMILIADWDSMKKSDMKGIRDIWYLITMMGFFSFFIGFLYNDFMSIPLQLSNTCFATSRGAWVGHSFVEGFVTLKKDCVYPFGMDYKWYSSKNGLVFFNAFKMKLAIILGVS